MTIGVALAPVVPDDLRRLVEGDHHDPHAILGPHPHGGGVTIRVLRPWAERVTVISGDHRVDLAHEYEGVFAGVLPVATVPDYRLEVGYHGSTMPADDP